MDKHHSSGFSNCKQCAELLAKENIYNVYWCDLCNKASVAKKPTEYVNCLCGQKLTYLLPKQD